MRISKSKSDLKNLTKIEASARHLTPEATCTVIDGCALLWIPQWPSSSSSSQKPMDYVKKFKHHILKQKASDVYLVFDRYEDFSTKSSTRTSRMAEGCKVYQ